MNLPEQVASRREDSSTYTKDQAARIVASTWHTMYVVFDSLANAVAMFERRNHAEAYIAKHPAYFVSVITK